LLEKKKKQGFLKILAPLDPEQQQQTQQQTQQQSQQKSQQKS